MKSVVICINNVEDFRDSDGLWVRSYSPELNVRHTTRSSALWNGINNRSKSGSAQQRRDPNYEGCSVAFDNYQLFAEWCNSEYGFKNREVNGKFWELDKDLLVPGNKAYGPDTCLFVPRRINTLILRGQKRRGEYPLGVCCKAETRFYSSCSYKGLDKHLGIFDTPMEAHKAWQVFKIRVIQEAIKEDPDVIPHFKLKRALGAYIGRLQYDLNNNIETI